MTDNKKLKTEILKVVRDRIHSGEVIDVVLNRRVDSDGDPLINIYVIFENKSNNIDAKETIGLSRTVRESLNKIGENSAPILYYVAKAEAGKLSESL